MSELVPAYDRIAHEAIYENYRQNSAFMHLASRAADEARKSGMDEREFRRGLASLYDAYSSFLSGVNLSGEASELKGWHNHFRKARLAKKIGEPFISQEVISGAVYTYLRGPMRVPEVDRGLIDCLIAQELFAFIDRSAGRAAFINWTAIFGAGMVFAGLASLVFGSFSWDRAKIVLLTFLGLYLLMWAFPLKGPYALYRQMKDTYQLLSGTVVSVPELRRRVSRAAERGVVWPPELYALLDDVEGRIAVL